MTRVASIGEAMIELSMAEANLAHVGVAGDTLNTAIYLKRAAPDLEVDYITRLGSDAFSDRIREAIATEGIGTDRIEVETGAMPGLYAISTSETGERSFSYWRGSSAARRLFQGPDGPDFSGLVGYDLVYLSGISLAILPPVIRAGLLDHLVETGQPFAFDSNYRPALWESREVARETMSAFFDRAKIALPSVDDEMALFGESAEQVIARFKSMGCLGAVKQGARGPVSLGAVVDQSYGAAPKVVDTTAAGDSFNGAYLAQHLVGQDQAQALVAAHQCALQVVQHRGAILPR
ncbi:sugar kinase [Thalassococcus sp. S3]|uniref:sugar kinase n=1 Tax=Thalassococcus sp. S3 TaxID=2017482 RepID=UPI0010243462|nr:sugar kinase [Thalassococcus sp. S3]QBF34199.1 2-dehydro-3-deoxygluconokinase [Thalassococcus sp. S3]